MKFDLTLTFYLSFYGAVKFFRTLSQPGEESKHLWKLNQSGLKAVLISIFPFFHIFMFHCSALFIPFSLYIDVWFSLRNYEFFFSFCMKSKSYVIKREQKERGRLIQRNINMTFWDVGPAASLTHSLFGLMPPNSCWWRVRAIPLLFHKQALSHLAKSGSLSTPRSKCHGVTFRIVDVNF